MNEDKSDIHSGIAVAIIFSIAAIIMSICSLARNSERILGFDYLGVIVGILTLLVTFLVAWQIWQTIGAGRKIKEIEAKVIGNEAFINARVCYTQGIFLMTNCISSSDKNLLKNLCVAYRNFLESFFYDLQSSKDLKRLNGCLSCMEKCLGKLQKENISFTKDIGDKCDTLFETILLMQLLTSPKLAERLNNLNKQRTGKHTSP